MEKLTPSKLIDLAKLLTPKEWKDLFFWLKAPWTKNEPKIVTLYELLSPHYPGFKGKYLNKEALFEALFPKEVYDNLKLNYLIRKLTESLEAYLAHLKLQKDKMAQQNALRNILLERQQIKQFETTSTNLLKTIAAKPINAAQDFLLRYQINRDLYYQPSTHRRYKADEELSDSNYALNEFFLLESYRYILEQKRRCKVLKKTTFTVPPALKQFLTSLRKQHISMPAALYEFKLQQPNYDWDTYLEFRTLFEKTRQQLPQELQQDFLFTCINDAVAFISKGDDRGLKELHHWYKLGMQYNLLSQYNTITGVTFNNVILMACHFDDITMIEKFLKNYQNKLPVTVSRDGKRWAAAHLHYAKGDYETCIDLLDNKIPKDPIFAIQARLTLLKANFKWVLVDVKHGARFQYYCLSMEQYLTRKLPYSADRNQATLRCIQFVKRIAKLSMSTPIEQKKFNTLKATIQNTPNLFGKSWLKKELDLLERKIDADKLPQNHSKATLA